MILLALSGVAYFIVGPSLVVWGEYRGWFPCSCARTTYHENRQCAGLFNYNDCYRTSTMVFLGLFWPVVAPILAVREAVRAAGRAREKSTRLASELKVEMAKAEREVEAMLKEVS